ncbi:uncharacterized protein [Pseudorasbora parva]|uniref:uncharacterized protein n=1 Tax=Pseudorasbora parva TaxID=51549 RepID=UPI00351E737F
MPSADREKTSAAMSEPAPEGAREPDISPNLRGIRLTRCEPTDPSIAEGVLVEFEGMEPRPPSTTEKSESSSSVLLTPPILPRPSPLQTAIINQSSVTSLCVLQSALQPSANLTIQSSLPPISPSVSSKPPLSEAATPQTGWESSIAGCLKPVAPPRPVTLAPSLLPPSAPAWTIGHSTSQGSLGRSAPPGSDIAITPLRTCGLFAALRPSTPSASASSAFCQVSPLPSIAPTPPLSSGSLLPPQGVVVEAQSQLPGSSVPLHLIGSQRGGRHLHHHPLRSGDVVHHSTMAPPSCNAALGHIPGWGLGLHLDVPVQGHPMASYLYCSFYTCYFCSLIY